MDLWIYLITTMIFSAFFSGMEIAFISSNKLHIEIEKKRGILSAKIFSFFHKNPSNLITTLLVGNNIALVVYGILFAQLLSPLLIKILPDFLTSDTSIMLLQTIISAIIILIFSEFLPKILFKINPNYIIHILAIPIIIIYGILFPIAFVSVTIAKYFWRIFFGIKITKKTHNFGAIDLDNYIKEFSTEPTTEEKKDFEMQMFQNAMDFNLVKVRDCMVPRTEIIAIDETESIEKLKNIFIESGLSKIIIFAESIENITGYVHSFDLYKKPDSIKSILRPIGFVPETMPANKLLTSFIQQRRSIAAVVDEFGGTSGIITIEDVIEEIFGEINDEYDVDELTEKQINENEFVFSGRLEIDYLNEKYHFNIPKSDDYQTLAGYIISYHTSIPAINEHIEIENFEFIISQSSENMIQQVIMKIKNN